MKFVLQLFCAKWNALILLNGNKLDITLKMIMHTPRPHEFDKIKHTHSKTNCDSLQCINEISVTYCKKRNHSTCLLDRTN